MLADTAATLALEIVLKPGWELFASPHDRFEESITVKIHYPAWNYNRALAPDYDEQPSFKPQASFTIPVGDIDDPVDLYLRIFDVIMQIEEHEWREAFRIHPTYWAPFHPHRLEGMRRWGDMRNDFLFGLS